MDPMTKIMQRVQARIGHRVKDRIEGEGATPWSLAAEPLTDTEDFLTKSSQPLRDGGEEEVEEAEEEAAQGATTSGATDFQSLTDMDRTDLDEYYRDVASRALGGV